MSTLFVLNLLGQKIQKLSSNGSDITTVLDSVTAFPDGVVIDKTHNHLYWTNMGKVDMHDGGSSFDNDGSLERCDLDGGNRTTIIPVGATNTPKQLTADWSTGKLYWCDREGLRVWRANLDGSQQELLLETGSTEADHKNPALHCVGITLDTVNGKIYWTQKGKPKGGEGKICRMNIDIPAGESPSERSDIEILWDNLPEPIDLYLDTKTSTLYWTDRGQEPKGNTLNKAKVPVQGQKGEEPTILLMGFKEAIGLELDPIANIIYATDLGGNIHYYSLSDNEGGILTHIDNAAFTGITVLD